MPSPARFLYNDVSLPMSAPDAGAVDSDMVMILASLLCALICFFGLALAARCAWIRRRSSSGAAPAQSPLNKGLKKKILDSLPKTAFSGDGKLADCAICLAEFALGEEIRALPQCGHVFHVGCIDTWLGSHSSCPSCRLILVAARCQKCGGLPPEAEGEAKPRESDENRFLP